MAACMSSLPFLLYLLWSAQVVSLGSGSPDCKAIEKVQPNLELRQQTEVKGSIKDQAGAPLKNSRVELRRYLSEAQQETVKVIHTNKNGEFKLGQIEPGKYRLLASPTRAFKQPDNLKCDEKSCSLSIVLEANATDQPDSLCPVR
jgi:5-hydroxyisourate hydrolase-like protein (transthyretin family)